MALRKYIPNGEDHSLGMKTLRYSGKVEENGQLEDPETSHSMEHDADIDLREVYFLIMHFLSAGPCHRTYGQLWNELLEHQLLPRRYHAWYSRSGAYSGDENDDGMSFPLSYNKLVQRYPHIEKDHLVKLLKQLILGAAPPRCVSGGNVLNAADVPTLLGTGAFSLISDDKINGKSKVNRPHAYMRWPHMQADQVRGLSLREIGGGFTRHHRAPSIRAACYAIAKPSTMVQKMQNTKRLRGHRNAVYCAIFDRLGRYVITGSDDRLVKIWSMETAYCLASCRGHEGDITDLAVSSNNALVASSSNDYIIRVWRLPDGLPISVLRGHTGAVTAIAFSPRPNFTYHLLSSSDDGTCRIWDARYSQSNVRVYVPRPSDSLAGKNSGPSSSGGPQNLQIFCCAFNANGTVFVTGSSDTLARVWSACKSNTGDSNQPNHEIDVLSGHENDVNYVQFSGCAVVSRFSIADTLKEENIPKFKNSWFTHDNIVTCSRDGSAIIWIPRSRRSHGKVGRWTRAYHLKVPPPPMLPQPLRGGPRQRILPTPRGVNMIVWSLDNRFVLAAIMDCRICVWNAADGSLVHSLTGHTASTYVLDVHPFNPRIAMSAGYDGKIIVWDIWEGKPIRVYEISRFKLVDGKFSPDGTSIILSDDVGQLYILSTGQGESQEDAKYDQFFLGDYRPLIQDTNGHTLDRETQLPPYRRNMEDQLCDSGMIPYPEPYQSMYQKRRLGALGIEYHPSTMRLAIGPDITLDQDYQIQPLADLDVFIDPLPEFLDAMDWEPEIEVQSDDDSEYNVPEEYSTAGEQVSLSSTLSGDPQCSTDDSDGEETYKDGLRRSRRKKEKEFDVMTSSGRRVKRRNLDECDGTSFRINQTRKSRNGQKASRRKSSTSKSLRPQRAAARNALNLFSKITGRTTEGEDEESSEGDDLSESESTLQDSNIESAESDRSFPNDQTKLSKGKEILLGNFEEMTEPHELPQPHMNTGTRKRLVLKLPNRDPNKHLLRESTVCKLDSQTELAGSSSKVPEDIFDVDQNHMSQDLGLSCVVADCSGVERARREQLDKVEGHLGPEGYTNGEFKWGVVKARTSKRLKLGGMTSFEADPGSNTCLGGYDFEKNANGCLKAEEEDGTVLPHLKIQNPSDELDGMVYVNGQHHEAGDSEYLDGTANRKEDPGFNSCGFSDKFPKSVDDDTTTAPVHFDNGTDHPPELKDNLIPTPTKFRIRSKRIARDSYVIIQDNPLDMEQNPVSEVPENNNTNKTNSDHKDNQLQDSAVEVNKATTLHGSQDLPSHSNKHFTAVYKRLKSRRKTSVGDIGMGESTSNASNNNHDAGMDFHEDVADGARRTRSMGLKVTTHDPNTVSNNIKLRLAQQPEDTFKSPQSSSMVTGQHQNEEWGSSTRILVGLRSSRNRRSSFYIRDSSPIDKRKSQPSTKKASWLMFSTHEEGSRYIPQKGDNVVYLRQGHLEYLNYSCAREVGPWTSIKGNIRAVEFCRVEDLEYSTHPGSGDSCCKMGLQFVDSTSTIFGKNFKLTLPEVTGFPDFLVERTRFDASLQRNWTCRDKCKVWWKNEGEEDGSWWDGRILFVKPKSSEYPDSPWERYTIQYKSDPTETHLHSPWELYDADTQWEQPCLDYEIRKKLLSAINKLVQSGNRTKDYYGVQKLMQTSEKSNFTNRFPVPLSLKVIISRLENNYYRSLEAVKHDITIMLSNAETYFGKNADISQKIIRLSDWFTKTLSSL